MDEKKTSKILIFGKNGQVGYKLCRTLSTPGEIYVVDIDKCDLTCKASITGTLDRFNPTVIANTAVDKAESERALAIIIKHKLRNTFGLIPLGLRLNQINAL